MICEKTVKKYCKDFTKIENYDRAIADTTKVWECHHCFEALFTKEELIKYDWYYDVEPNCLVFLTQEEHISLHNKGRSHSEEAKRKIGKALKNRKDQSKKVMCVETGEIFESVNEASRKTRISIARISEVCNGKRKTTGGYHWSFVRPDTNTEN